MIATLYLRSAAQSATSIAEQRDACEAHAAAEGWRIGETFTDDGVSAFSEDRPGMTALHESVRDGCTTLILAHAPGNLFRSIDGLDDFTSFCEAHGVRIAYVCAPSETSAEIRRINLERRDAAQATTSREIRS